MTLVIIEEYTASSEFTQIQKVGGTDLRGEQSRHLELFLLRVFRIKENIKFVSSSHLATNSAINEVRKGRRINFL
jgi:hypothetical protein